MSDLPQTQGTGAKEGLLSFLGILLLAALVRCVIFSGVSATDPLGYIEYAYRIISDSYHLELHHYNARYAVFLPVAFFMKLFGVNQIAVLVWPVLCSLATFYLVFRLGARIVGTGGALTATWLLAILPVHVRMSTDLLPEPILIFFMTLGVYCFHKGYHHEDERRGAAWIVAAGLALWAAWSAKMIGAFLLPPLLLYGIVVGRRWRRLLLLLFVFAAALFAEFASFHAHSGDWLFRLHAVEAVHEKSPMAIQANRHLLDRLLVDYPRRTILPSFDMGVTFLFIWIAVAWALRRLRRNLILLLWFSFLFAYLNFGSSSLTHYVALPVAARYLLPVIVPGMILLGGMLRDLSVRRGVWRFAVVGLVAALSLSSLSLAYLGTGSSYTALTAKEIAAVSDYLQSHRRGTVYADPRSRRMLQFLMGYDDVGWLKGYPAPAAAEDAEGYRRRFEKGSLLICNNREMNKVGPYARLPREQSDLIRRMAQSPSVRPVYHVWERRPALFEWLGRLPVIRSLLPGDLRVEYFVHDGSSRGTDVLLCGG